MIALGNALAQSEDLGRGHLGIPRALGAQERDLEIGDIDAMELVPSRPSTALVGIGERVAQPRPIRVGMAVQKDDLSKTRRFHCASVLEKA